MNLRFYFRHSNKLNRSIEKVFDAVSSGLEKDSSINIEKYFAWYCRIWPIAMIWNMIRMGFISWRKGINHVTGDIHYVTLLMPRNRTVLTIHDLVSLHNDNISPFIKRFIYYLWYYLPLKHLKYITCISEATKNDLVTLFPFAASKVIVVPNPISEDFTEAKLAKNHPPVILHIGTRTNKNLERVILALKSLECHLRIIGKLTPEQENLLKESHIDFSNVYGLSDEEVVTEYHKCDIVSFPSLFEGFGMPIIEGQACGKVVVTSNREPMKSVSGGGAVLVSPENIDSIRLGFESVINNVELQREIIKKGLKNVSLYSSKAIALKYKSLYEKIL